MSLIVPDSLGSFDGESPISKEYPRLHMIKATDLDPETAQSSGMRRFAAVSGRSVGSQKLWMGQTIVAPGNISANHHHGESETAIYVVSGTPEFIFLDVDADADPDDPHVQGREVRLRTKAGDYIFVPPFVPHREENLDPLVEAVVVIARSTQDAIVVNLDNLNSIGSVRTTADSDSVSR